MPGKTIIVGQAREIIYSGTNVSVPGSMALGTFDTGLYARFCGLASVLGSVTIRYRSGINSANTTLITSSFVANSGYSTFDVLNYGMVTEFWLSAANSQVMPAILIYGEGIR